jgi:hypothetical protein
MERGKVVVTHPSNQVSSVGKLRINTVANVS